MAYRRRTTSRARTANRRKSYNRAPARRRGNTRVRRAAGANRQTLRIVIEQPSVSAVARPEFSGQTEKPNRKATF